MICKIYNMVSLNIKPDQPDANGRIWPRNEIVKAISEFNTRIPVICEMTTDKTDIDISNASHYVTGLRLNNGCVEASFQVLDTPTGKILQDLIEDGVVTNISISAKARVNVDANTFGINISDATFINIGINTEDASYKTMSLSNVRF